MLNCRQSTRKTQGSGCTPRRYCTRRFWVFRSIHRTRIISITNDSSKSHGYHLQIARVRGTSSWRSIYLDPGKNGRCPKIVENSQIGMSRHLDSSTTTQMAKIMVQYGRSSRSSWKEFVRSSFGRTIMGKAIWESPIETWTGENSKLGMSLCTSWKRIFLICVCGWHKIGWKETKSWSDVESTQQRSGFGRTNIFPWSCVLEMHSKTMRNKQKYCGQLQNHVWIANFRGEQLRNYHSLKIFGFFHGRMTWWVMQRNVWNDIVSWQRRRLSNSTKYLLHASMTTTSKKKKQNLLENCQIHALKLFWNAYIWQELWSVNKLARSISKWTKACDKRLNRLISKIHQTCEYKQYRYVGNTAKTMQIGTVSGLWRRGRSWRFKIHFWVLWKSYVCSNRIVLLKEKDNFDEINHFFMNNYWSKIGTFVKLTRKVSMKWNEVISRLYIRYNFKKKIDRRSRHYPWTHRKDSGIAKWSKLYERFKRIFRMLNPFAVEIPTLPVDQCHSHFIQFLVGW